MADVDLARLFMRIEKRRPLRDEQKATLRASVDAIPSYGAKQDVVLEGSRPKKSSLLLSGLAMRYTMLFEGKRQITAIHVPGDFVDLHSYPLEVMDHTVATLTDCRFATFPHISLERMVQDVDLAKTLWMLTLLDAALHREWLAAMGALAAPARAAHLFCELAVRLAVVGLADEREYQFPINQSDLSDVLGLSAVHTNRTLQELRSRELIEFERGMVRINNWQALRRLAQFDTKYLHLRSDESY